MKLFWYTDELYPIYYLSKEKFIKHKILDIPQELFADFQKNLKEFWEIQSKIKKELRKHGEVVN